MYDIKNMENNSETMHSGYVGYSNIIQVVFNIIRYTCLIAMLILIELMEASMRTLSFSFLAILSGVINNSLLLRTSTYIQINIELFNIK